ncbi:MAG: hypothetical protein NZM42_12860 [Gemmatales bacterium]|nr:hypothetical protein [Gemmatales bacterium]
MVDLLGQRLRAVTHFLEKVLELSHHACLDKLVVRQERIGLEVRDARPVTQVGGADVRAGIHPLDGLRMQDVGRQLAVEVRAGFVEKPLQHRRIDGHGVVVSAKALQRLQVLCAGRE